MKIYDVLKPTISRIEKKMKGLVENQQVALFVTVGHGTPLAYSGDSAITAWFMEKYGFEFKQKAAELLRNGEAGSFSSSSERSEETRLKNLCHLPLLEYHIDDTKIMNTKVIKRIYSKMMSAEGLSRSYGVESKMPAWWVDAGATTEQKQEETEFWKIQIGCNPPTGVASQKMNWPSTLKKYVLRCYLHHLGSMDAVRDYYEYVNEDQLDTAFNEDAAEKQGGAVDKGPRHMEGDNAKETGAEAETEETTFTPNYLPGVFTWGATAPLPDKSKPVVLQYKAFIKEDHSGKVYNKKINSQ